MSQLAAPSGLSAQPRPDLGAPTSTGSKLLFGTLTLAGIIYMVFSLRADFQDAGTRSTTWLPFLLLGVALLIALGFEFVNGFHDTANAVATVIYTHSLPAPLLSRAAGQAAPTVVDPRTAGFDLHGREFRARVQ